MWTRIRDYRRLSFAALVVACPLVDAVETHGASLPEPLGLEHAVEYALSHRPEISAGTARAQAQAQRPAIVGALEDPVISSAIDHYPFDTMDEEDGGRRYDWSVTVEQRIPLSGVLTQRRRAATAEAAIATADLDRVKLDVAYQVQEAYLMLHERRRMVAVLSAQHQLADSLVASAAARYAAGTGLEADVLRAEVEVARIESESRVLEADSRAAEAMLNASLGRATSASLPALAPLADPPPLRPVAALTRIALDSRPELTIGEAEVDRAAAEIDVMESMYRPMAMVRLGRATTMAEGEGAMAMIGVSVPIWRSRLAAGVNEARAMHRMAQADLAGMSLMVEADVAAARAGVVGATDRLAALRSTIVPRTELAVDSALASYAAGRSSMVTVVESATSLWAARSERVMAETALAQAQARLDRAVGQELQASP